MEFAHEHNVKVYVTANILAHNRDLPGAREYFEELKQVKPDALIISDPAIFTIAKEILPDMEIHISTQANNTNYGTFNFWHGLEQNGWLRQENCLWKRLRKSGSIFRRIWRLKPLFMGQCVFLIPGGAF